MQPRSHQLTHLPLPNGNLASNMMTDDFLSIYTGTSHGGYNNNISPSSSLEMEAFTKSVVMVVVVFIHLSSFFSTSHAYTFLVGGGKGVWVQSPSEPYNTWAERSRFSVNDTIVFKYKKGDDSVLQVSKADYDSCSTSNPIQKLDGGDSTFRFDRSGPFYFVSGVSGHCQNGQKVIVIVLAVRNKKPSPTTPPSTSPSPSPPTNLTPVPSPSFPPTPSSSAPAAQPPTRGSNSPSGSGTTPATAPPSPKSSSSTVSAASGLVFGLLGLVLGSAFLN